MKLITLEGENIELYRLYRASLYGWQVCNPSRILYPLDSQKYFSDYSF